MGEKGVRLKQLSRWQHQGRSLRTVTALFVIELLPSYMVNKYYECCVCVDSDGGSDSSSSDDLSMPVQFLSVRVRFLLVILNTVFPVNKDENCIRKCQK